MTQGTCTVHSWNDGLEEDEAEPRMGHRVDTELNPNPRLYERPADPRGFRRVQPLRGVARRANEDNA